MPPSTAESRGLARKVWDRLCRFQLTRDRASRRSLDRFCAEFATTERTLSVHCVDVDHRRHFPNCFTISSRRSHQADVYADKQYAALADVADASYGVIVCTGLLEHLAEPAAIVAQFARILRPGGRLIVSASAVFPFHGAPDNYFHFTPGGFRHLFRDWARIETLRGSSGPYATLAILAQRINIQCDVFPPVRLLNELLVHALPHLDRFVLRQYDNVGVREAAEPVDSIMPATLLAVVVR